MSTCSAGAVMPVGSVAIVGAGGIGFDVAEFLVHEGAVADPGPPALDGANGASTRRFESPRRPGASAAPEPPARQVWLLQRSAGKPGARLGKTTGWIHRATLKAKGVKMLGGVEYGRSTTPACTSAIDGDGAGCCRSTTS